MKVSYQWLQDFIALSEAPQAVADRLSLSGLEVAAVEPALPALDGLIVATVERVEKHPDADKLSVCQVDVGTGEAQQIVCGAPNVRVGMKVPAILPGSKLPDGTKIRKAKLRGVESSGMLCSARELGLSEDHSGLMDLPADAPVGMPLADYLGAGDAVIDIEITPNRGDCLGVLGVARDLSALYDLDLRGPAVREIPAQDADRVSVELRAPRGCPKFLGRVVRGVNPNAATPLWMRERLRRSGIRPVSPLVDITQYVMLELGQPMHAYDLREIRGGIVVRMAEEGEVLELLDGNTVRLEPDMLVIADHERIVGLAGIMGGEGSGVRDDTRDVYLECAWFDPSTINGRSRRLGLHTDAGYRFERGVDPEGQRRAMERATELLVAIAGGTPAAVVETISEQHLPRREAITLRRARLRSLLGMTIPDADVWRILGALGMPAEPVDGGWRVMAPSHRFDIEIEEDLVEEVGRIYGYDHIEPAQYPSAQAMETLPEEQLPVAALRQALVHRGYQEVVTYSFVDRSLQEKLTGAAGIELANPITADMTHMRRTLWAGLIQALQYNLNRQQRRIRVFETGLRFLADGEAIAQDNMIGGLLTGPAFPEQWGIPARDLDFFDVKGDLESLFALTGRPAAFALVPDSHPALHPGQSARIDLDGQTVGWVGAIHPALEAELDLGGRTFVFEMALAALQSARLPRFEALSRFPSIRRDLALSVPEAVSAAAVAACVREAAAEWLRDLLIFDVYRGKGVASNCKGLGLGLILQEYSRTLTDEEVEQRINQVVERLDRQLGATLRG